ncbi:hypothetical protein IT072_13895 [Leifsonia sp. ZF2019]|uniref:hypothetical protein n=1 Tax=Leifsonia sp. ZF2019 TaxID=2781978 RepID=UPI001CBB8F27|nr:hypothetical protein [Leifsonia sp. ZF2019]UAJ78350.1 hypothetical protein IT072_13895 [Leifsonia sp. ZF2019]
MSAPTKALSKANLSMPLADLLDLVTAVAPAVSNDFITPVITGALFTLDKGRITLMGTDRYRVHRVRGDYKGSPSGTFIVPQAALKWLTKNAAFFGRRRISDLLQPWARIDFRFEPISAGLTGTMIHCPRGTVTITISEPVATDAASITYTLPLIKGGFPPLHELFDKAESLEPVAAAGAIRMDLLADTKRIARDKWEAGKFKVVQPNTSGKPGQFLVQYERGEALLQMHDGSRP